MRGSNRIIEYVGINLKSFGMKRGDRLRLLRKLRGISQEDLAAAVGCSQGMITQLENKDNVNSGFLYEIAKFLNADMEWIKTGQGRDPRTSDFIEIGYVPLIEWHEITKPLNLSNILSIKKRESIPNPLYNRSGHNCFAVKVKGDSMVSSLPNKPSFLENSIIIIDPDKTATTSDFVVAIQDHENAAIFAQIINYGSTSYLKPLNPQYPTLIIDEKTIIAGVVIAHINVLI